MVVFVAQLLAPCLVFRSSPLLAASHLDFLNTSSLGHLEEIVQDPRVFPRPPLALELPLAPPRPKPLAEELLQAVARGARDILHAALVRQEHLPQAATSEEGEGGGV